MDRNFIKQVFEKIEINEQAQIVFYEIFDNINKNCDMKNLFENTIDIFLKNPRESFDNKVNENLTKIQNRLNVDRYSLDFVFLICSSKGLKDKFKSFGYSNKMFWDNMKDFKCKNDECYNIKGTYGTFVTNWYVGLFELKRFSFERLQFEFGEYREQDIIIDNYKIKQGYKVVFIHIPSSGSLEKDLVLKSLKKAYEFFSVIYEQDKIIFICDSWLLYPKIKKIMPKNSNIVQFLDLFTILKINSQDDFADGWRIFGKQWNDNYKELPEKTTMQKCFKSFLVNGNKLGIGLGLFVYDGNKIYN